MSYSQDPSKLVGYLQQRLSSNKTPLGLFLGAGCPYAIKDIGKEALPLIPDIAGITRIVREKLGADKECSLLLKTLDGHFETDSHANATVEDMLSHVRALRAVVGKGEVRGFSAGDLDKLDERICGLIHELASKSLPSTKTPFHAMASWVNAIGGKMSVLDDTGRIPVEIFTTNYDLLIEQAFEDIRVPYFDGFPGARKPFFDLRAMEEDDLPVRWARLWKLHGSINWWYQAETKGVFRGAVAGEEGSRRVIHPSYHKHDEIRQMPYMAMMDRLRAFLKRSTSTLVFCGHSFQDSHLNKVMIRGLQHTQTAIAFALLFDKMAKYPEAIRLAAECSNLSLLARDGAVISGQEFKWPTRDAGVTSTDDNEWVKWNPVDPSDKKSPQAASFTLGDFTTFGCFLQQLIPEGHRLPVVPYVG